AGVAVQYIRSLLMSEEARVALHRHIATSLSQTSSTPEQLRIAARSSAAVSDCETAFHLFSRAGDKYLLAGNSRPAATAFTEALALGFGSVPERCAVQIQLVHALADSGLLHEAHQTLDSLPVKDS